MLQSCPWMVQTHPPGQRLWIQLSVMNSSGHLAIIYIGIG